MPFMFDAPGGCVILTYNEPRKPVILCPDIAIAQDQIVDGDGLETFVTNASGFSVDLNPGESLAVNVCRSDGVYPVTLLRNADAGSITVDTKNPAAYVSYKMQGRTLHLSKEEVVKMVGDFLAK